MQRQPPDSGVFCSLVVPSVGDANLLARCIDSIEDARGYGVGAGIETIVVVQGSGLGQSEGLLRGRARVEHMGRRSLSLARNRGIELARGEYLFFVDDDAVLAKDALRVLFNAASAGDSMALCGQLLELGTGCPYVPNEVPISGSTLRWGDFQRFAGSCHIVCRSAFARVGLYDERFGVGATYSAGEETDLFFRLLKFGARVRYVPELIVYHPSARQFSAGKTFSYAFGNGALHAKHAWGVLPRHYRSFIRIILVNCMRIAVDMCVRFRWNAVAWARVSGNCLGFWEFIMRNKLARWRSRGVAY